MSANANNQNNVSDSESDSGSDTTINGNDNGNPGGYDRARHEAALQRRRRERHLERIGATEPTDAPEPREISVSCGFNDIFPHGRLWGMPMAPPPVQVGPPATHQPDEEDGAADEDEGYDVDEEDGYDADVSGNNSEESSEASSSQGSQSQGSQSQGSQSEGGEAERQRPESSEDEANHRWRCGARRQRERDERR